MDIVVRRLTDADLPAAAEVYRRTFNEPPWNDGWPIEAAQERLERYHGILDSIGVVAIEDGELLGFALGVAERWVDGEHFHLKEMCTTPGRQRSGIGALVMDELMSLLSSRGVQAIYLETRPDSGAANFYTRHGFRILNLQSMARSVGAGGS